jgi:hypothetical protein
MCTVARGAVRNLASYAARLTLHPSHITCVPSPDTNRVPPLLLVRQQSHLLGVPALHRVVGAAHGGFGSSASSREAHAGKVVGSHFGCASSSQPCTSGWGMCG